MEIYHQFRMYLGKRVHLGITGSIAAYKILDLMRGLQECGTDTGATLTPAGEEFIPSLGLRALGADPLYTGKGREYAEDTFAHLEPGKSAQSLLIAPVTANTLAKIAAGFADDLLSAQVLSFPGPVLLAPAMNPAMWQAKATRENWSILGKRGFIRIPPDTGGTACGDQGQGRLAKNHLLLLYTLKTLTSQDLSGKSVLITCGPTRERYDPVRYWTNPSSGKMGLALAVSAWLRGAYVDVVHGPITPPELPPEIKTTAVVSARDMHEAVQDMWPEMDIGCFAAAVADFRPAEEIGDKAKKGSREEIHLSFLRNPDTLAQAGKNKKHGQILAGFAAESSDLDSACSQKLKNKNLDMIVGNYINTPDSGFTSDQNAVTVLDFRGRKETWPPLDKTEVAWRIWDWVGDLR